MDKVTT